MKKAFAKIVLIVALSAICFAQVATFSACQKKEHTVLMVKDIDRVLKIPVNPSQETVDYFTEKIGEIAPVSVTSGVHGKYAIRFCPIEEADGEVVFLADNPSKEDDRYEGLVVTTKWMYYSALIDSGYAKWDGDPQKWIDAYENEEYTMEKVALFTEFYRCPNKDHPDCHTDVDKTELRGFKSDPACCDEYLSEPSIVCRREVQAAALARYGILSTSEEDRNWTWLSCWDNREWGDDIYRWEASKLAAKRYKIIGYIETEADRLMSTGVSMDRNSKEYKIVTEQLQNPVVYVSNGDSLQGVRYVETE